MRQGDTSRRRRLIGTDRWWYSQYRATRFSLRMFGERRDIYEAATITINRIQQLRLRIETMTTANQNELAQLVANILNWVYVISRPHFEKEAQSRRITLEQLAAAAICQGVLEMGNKQ